MIGVSCKPGITLLMVTSIGFSALIGCMDNGDPSEPPMAQPEGTRQPAQVGSVEDRVITIGNLTDLTGVSANAMEYINMALDDLTEYYNENDLIPGVELKVVTYDGQMDPARDIPGYEWLRGKGADLIFTPIPSTPVTLKSRVDTDQVVLFALVAAKDEILPPGYVFNLGTVPQYDAYTLLKWIADNDWDYEAQGPAKIGGAGWNDQQSGPFIDGMQEYCAAHPDQFEWEGGYLTNFSFTWGAEVEALRDCDYVYPGIVFVSFVQQYRSAGCTRAKLVGAEPQTAFFKMVDDAGLWDEIDGMLFVKFSRWWNEEGEMATLVRQLLNRNHPSDTERIVSSGVGYLSINQIYPMLQIVADAAARVGPANLDSQALYDAATSFVMTADGVRRLSFGEEKRQAVDSYGVYEARAGQKDIFRLQEEWLPAVRIP